MDPSSSRCESPGTDSILLHWPDRSTVQYYAAPLSPYRECEPRQLYWMFGVLDGTFALVHASCLHKVQFSSITPLLHDTLFGERDILTKERSSVAIARQSTF